MIQLELFSEEQLKLKQCESLYGCSNYSNQYHTCPFSEEINGDSNTECNCCENCTAHCAEEI